MPASSITGIASGIDWQSTIDALMEIEGRRKAMLEIRRGDYQAKLSAWQDVNSKLLQFKTLADNMDLMGEFLTKSISSSDTDIATATANSSASSGNFQLEINQLARAEKEIHAGWIDFDTTDVNSSGGAQTFVYDFGATTPTTITVSIPDGSTLGDVRDLINNDSDNPGVNATIINDGSGGATAHHLVLTATDTGADNTITISDTTTLGDGTSFDSAAWTQTQSGVNAQLRLDGYPPASWMESASNDVEDIIEGVTIHLTNVSGGTTVVLSINNDTNTVKSKIQEYIDSYNSCMTLINTYNYFSEESEERSLLFGDSGLISIKQKLQTLLSFTIPGLNSNNTLQSLGEIGITSGTDGMLAIDDTELSEALADHFNEVGELFTFNSGTNSSYLDYFYRTENTQGGEYSVVANYDGSGNLTSATIDGHATTIENNIIVAADGFPEEGLRLRFTPPGGGAGSETATIRLSMGVAPEIANRLAIITDSTDGTVTQQSDHIDTVIENLNEQIEDQEYRLALIREKYVRSFTNMELQLSRLQQQSSYLSSQLASLG
ncbi:MAG: flagellar filament capping protein FliD [Candidatus Delongbacteria bacterium]|nr:flagellar filament capping protein FliD [Candidatus Delongbacteria bacterium]